MSYGFIVRQLPMELSEIHELRNSAHDKDFFVKDEDLYAPVVDYSKGYPYLEGGVLGEANYKQLKSGSITVGDREIPTSPLSSYPKAREIAETLKEWIQAGEFLLGEPVAALPSADSGYAFKLLNERPVEESD